MCKTCLILTRWGCNSRTNFCWHRNKKFRLPTGQQGSYNISPPARRTCKRHSTKGCSRVAGPPCRRWSKMSSLDSSLHLKKYLDSCGYITLYSYSPQPYCRRGLRSGTVPQGKVASWQIYRGNINCLSVVPFARLERSVIVGNVILTIAPPESPVVHLHARNEIYQSWTEIRFRFQWGNFEIGKHGSHFSWVQCSVRVKWFQWFCTFPGNKLQRRAGNGNQRNVLFLSRNFSFTGATTLWQ